MKKIAILQSNYIPWKGYFDLINMVDEFILYDDMQYTRRDWRNRNKIMTSSGAIWLTVPVENKGKFLQKINETKVSGNEWIEKHWNTIYHNYHRTQYFTKYSEEFENVYKKCRDEEFLSSINYLFLKTICRILGIKTKLSWSSDYVLADGKTERLVKLVLDASGSYYLSGPAAKDYIVPELFEVANIELAWMDYSGYPEYRQILGKFEHNVSILDLIFNEGQNATKFMKSFKGIDIKNNGGGVVVIFYSHNTPILELVA